jgi:hypothetical protein
LFAATWKLWTPQTAFPQVPLFAFARSAPAWCDWLLVGIGATGGALGLVRGSHPTGRWGLIAFTLALGGLIVLDQHRFQPWAWQTLLAALLFACLPPAPLRFWLAVLTIGIYAYSAISKLDHAFVYGAGQPLLHTLVGFVGLQTDLWPRQARIAGAACFPAIELLIAVALCFRRTRRVGLCGAILMHAVTILILGPWGLGHRPGVLLWNACFIAQDVLLFGPRWLAGIAAPDSRGPLLKLLGLVARLAVVLAVTLPAVEPWGLWDHWPAWGLYAGHAERVSLRIKDSAAEKLPAAVQPFLVADKSDPGWSSLRLDRWSLAAVDAPLYPQARFELGAAWNVVETTPLPDNEFVILVESAANRWTGVRTRTELPTREAIAQYAERFRFNCRGRN